MVSREPARGEPGRLVKADGGGYNSPMARESAALTGRGPAGLLLVLTAAFGAACGADEPASTPQDVAEPGDREGRFRPVRQPGAVTAEQQRELDRLRSIGYSSGTQEAGSREGVVLHDTGGAQEGLNFFASGHHAGAALMDMKGRVLHEWRRSFHEVWPDEVLPESSRNHEFWRRAHLFENGDVLAIFEGLGIIKVDKDSNVLWARLNGAHHDLEVLDDGDILVLTRTAHLLSRLDPVRPTLEDFMTLLGPDGTEKRSVSVFEAFENGGHPEILRMVPPKITGDVLHTNTLHYIDEAHAALHPFLEAGQLLISARRTNVVALVDFEEEKVLRIWSKLFLGQHDPKILDDGSMLVFDNRKERGKSRVIAIDPETSEILWRYRGNDQSPFFTATCGTSERLQGGTTLITESDNGRAFEVTPEGEIVWEFVSPYRVGANREYVATLFEVLRLPPDFPVAWIDQ